MSLQHRPAGVGSTVEISEIESLALGTGIFGDGDGAPTTLAAGANNTILTADSGEAAGVKWTADPVFDSLVIDEALTVNVDEGTANNFLVKGRSGGFGNLFFVDVNGGSGTLGAVGIGITVPFLNFASSDGDFTAHYGLHIDATSQNGAIVVEGDLGGHLIVGDSGGGVDDKIIDFEVDGGVGTFRSLKDDLTTLKDNILVLDIGTGNAGFGTATPAKLIEIASSSVAGVGDLDTGPVLRLNNTNNSSIWGDGGEEQLHAIEFFITDASGGGDRVKASIRVLNTNDGNIPESIMTFSTATAAGSEVERMRIDQDGKVGFGIVLPLEKFQVDDAIAISNNSEGSTARLTTRTSHETHTLDTATTSNTTTISIPSGARLLGVSMNVNTAVTNDGDNRWSAAFITGNAQSIVSLAAAAQNTKVNFIVPDDQVTSAVTQIQFTPQGGSFTAGIIEIVAYYEELTSLADV